MQRQASRQVCSTLHIPEHTRASSQLYSGVRELGLFVSQQTPKEPM